MNRNWLVYIEQNIEIRQSKLFQIKLLWGGHKIIISANFKKNSY